MDDAFRAYCDADQKVIRVRPGETGVSLTAVLIHEIAHSAVCHHHGTKFRARLKSAAALARSLGRESLVEELERHIEMCEQMVPVRAQEVYDRIRAALCDDPTASFTGVVDWIRQDFGLSCDDFLKRFPRCEQVFLANKEEQREWGTAEKRLQETLDTEAEISHGR